MKPPYLERWDAYSNLNMRVQETVSGFKVVKALSLEKLFAEFFDTVNRSILTIGIRVATHSALSWPLLSLIAGFAVAAVYWYGGLGVASGELTVGDIAALTSYISMLLWPLIMLGFITNRMQMCRVPAGRSLRFWR